MAAILKNGRHLKFQVASVFFKKSNPQRVFTPNLVLVSYFERFAGKIYLLHYNVTASREIKRLMFYSIL